VTGDREYFNIDDTIPIYYYKDLIAYQLPFEFDSSNLTYHVKADSISEKHILTETRYNYFVYRNGSQTGMWYFSIDQLDSHKSLSVDSILKIKSKPENLQSIIFNSSDSLLNKMDIDNGFIEKFVPRSKTDESYCDTFLLYYSRSMRSIPFSLSPFLDSLTNTKLYKLKLVYNEMYSQQYSVTMPRRDIVYEIEPINSTTPHKIKGLFKRFIIDEMKLLN
jgi:hypothetical protein